MNVAVQAQVKIDSGDFGVRQQWVRETQRGLSVRESGAPWRTHKRSDRTDTWACNLQDGHSAFLNEEVLFEASALTLGDVRLSANKKQI